MDTGQAGKPVPLAGIPAHPHLFLRVLPRAIISEPLGFSFALPPVERFNKKIPKMTARMA